MCRYVQGILTATKPKFGQINCNHFKQENSKKKKKMTIIAIIEGSIGTRRHKKVVLNYTVIGIFKNNCFYHMNFMAGTFQDYINDINKYINEQLYIQMPKPAQKKSK